ncbi:MAG: glycosyltransferase family 9 protein [Gammaproteobacteria bacterium]|nr:glycosyltransferase family 9 protein [Gammaproteobacteria bacterium]
MTATTASADARAPRLLVVRNDKLGDFMLAWPALAALKKAKPAPHVSVLVPAYTAPMARLCPWIDDVVIDPGEQAPKDAQRALLATLRQGGFTAMLTLYSTTRIGWLGLRSGIPLRMAPATKWAQLFYNRRVTQRRSRSAKPEYIYNLELAEAMIQALGLSSGQPSQQHPAPPYWPLAPQQRDAQRSALGQALGLDDTRPWVFLHPGSGGSAVNLTPEAYAGLAQGIDRRLAESGERPPHWILTAGPGEEAVAEALVKTLDEAGLSAYRQPACAGLADFARSLAAADAFIAGSTGPLHVAGCLNLITVGFYPSHRSATPLRWQTCNDADRRLAFHPPTDAAHQDMSAIDLEAAAAATAARLRKVNHHRSTA